MNLKLERMYAQKAQASMTAPCIIIIEVLLEVNYPTRQDEADIVQGFSPEREEPATRFRKKKKRRTAENCFFWGENFFSRVKIANCVVI